MTEEPQAELPDKPTDDWRAELAESLTAPNPWRLSHLLYLIMAIAVVLWMMVTFRAVVIPLIIVLGVALLTGAAVILIRGRASQQDSLLWMLAIAAEHQMPLARTVAAFADQYSGRYRRRVLRVAALLDGGLSLPEALERTPRVVSSDALLLAHVGHESGELAEALRTAASIRAARAPIWAAISTRVAYILGVLFIIQGIVGFILYFIMPKFEAIFKDFGVSLPPTTIFVLEASHFLIKYLFWFPALNVLLLLFLPFVFAGRSNFEVPFLDRLLKRRHTALILRSLAISIEGGRKIEGGLKTLATRYPTRWVRKKLVAVAREAEHGADWREALMNRGLLQHSDYEVLSSAAAVGNLPWAMNELAETAERRLGIRVQAVVQTLFPLVICAIGALILVIAVGFFAPLVELIGRLSG
ncbi:MAG: type II secretion system F family protein [Paludisphaera borealis]|uniref:type II secretion system F family protein n=1 Tax=Paludisphaera borealis TaxID=1387353 RepID=UPI00283BF38A|nr:type II secretion system F family protein [Paludisphaera borealis]MDR3622208.1 type II secretion system F family protein [Paludisphaera borealis]